MWKVLDKINDIYFVRLTFTEYTKVKETWIFDDDEENFDEAIKSKKVKSKLSLLASKL